MSTKRKEQTISQYLRPPDLGSSLKYCRHHAGEYHYDLIADPRPRASDTDEQLYGLYHKKYELWVEFDPNNKDYGWPVSSKPSYGTLVQLETWLKNWSYEECELAAKTSSERSKRSAAFELLTLDQLAVAIKKKHEAAEASIRDSLMHARVVGEMLIVVKARLPHGEWMPWVEAHCQFSHSTALIYQNVAYRWDELANSQPVENLTLHAAVNALAETRREVKAVEREQYAASHHTSHKEEPSDRERRLFHQYIDDFLQPGSQEELVLDVILHDHEVGHGEIERTLNVVIELQSRVNTAIEKLTERMAIDVDSDVKDKLNSPAVMPIRKRLALVPAQNHFAKTIDRVRALCMFII